MSNTSNGTHLPMASNIQLVLEVELQHFPPSFPNMLQKATNAFIASASFLVFAFLDLADLLLCFFYWFLDGMLEENPIPCYCGGREEQRMEEFSETLFERRNLFRGIGLCSLKGRKEKGKNKKKGELRSRPPRWSDCGCESCVSWQGKGEVRLHLVVKQPSQDKQCGKESIENVIFLHGFVSSSSFWTESVFPNLSRTARLNLLAVDILGFGKSPKPMDCLYSLKDHVDMVEKSAILPFHLDSFHLVAHSMGCVIALALAAKHPQCIKSITLVAPPYFSSTKGKASLLALNRLAERKVWPPLLFGSSVMSWYEHLGRTVCFLVCRNHRTWEWIVRLLSRKRDLPSAVMDLTRHTHHSAWHTMHNVICGGAKLMDNYLEVLKKESIPVKVVHGEKDAVAPLECSYKMKEKLPLAELEIVPDADHTGVIFGREKAFARELEEFWFCSKK